MSGSASRLWNAYLASGSPHALDAAGATYSAWQFGYGVDQGDRLVDCVLDGPKRATTGALWTYEAEGEAIPVPGDYSVILDGRGVARCVIRTTRVDVIPFDEVDAAFAYDEGEGDRSLEYWRDVHWTHFVRELAGLGREATQDMPVVCERFEVVYRAQPKPGASRAGLQPGHPLEIRPLESVDRQWSDALVVRHFGSNRVVSRGRLHDPSSLPGLLAVSDRVPVGLLLYRVEADTCELVVLVVERPREGIATALVRAFVEQLCAMGCARAWLVTTNDNVAAQSFYESLGWKLTVVHRGAVARARELKPEIPECGEHGVAIEDELEYELDISRGDQTRRR